MIVLEFLFRLIGGFYLLASLIAVRRILLDALLDHAIARLSMKPTPAIEITKRRLLVASIVLAGMSGMALAVMSLWALPLFAVTIAAQFHLMRWSARYDPPEGKGGAQDRARSVKAAFAFAAIGVGVLLLASLGALTPLGEPWRLAAISGAGLALGAMILRGLDRLRRKPSFSGLGGGLDGGEDDAWEEESPETEPRDGPPHYAFEADPGGRPLENIDRGERVDHGDILSPALAARLTGWNAAALALTPGRTPDAFEFTPTLLDEARGLLEAIEAEVGMVVACRYRPEAMAWRREQRLTSDGNYGATGP